LNSSMLCVVLASGLCWGQLIDRGVVEVMCGDGHAIDISY
jgi:hypothetical protein